jgi:hypothetical protein
MMSMISLLCNRAWFASISVPEIRLSARSPIEDAETLKWEAQGGGNGPGAFCLWQMIIAKAAAGTVHNLRVNGGCDAGC